MLIASDVSAVQTYRPHVVPEATIELDRPCSRRRDRVVRVELSLRDELWVSVHR